MLPKMYFYNFVSVVVIIFWIVSDRFSFVVQSQIKSQSISKRFIIFNTQFTFLIIVIVSHHLDRIFHAKFYHVFPIKIIIPFLKIPLHFSILSLLFLYIFRALLVILYTPCFVRRVTSATNIVSTVEFLLPLKC